MPSSPAAPTKLVPLGKNGPLIPQLGLGLMGLTHQVYGSNPTEEEQFAFLDRAYELGARNWDTSDLYGNGETIIGKWFKRTGKRDDIFLATKVGYVKGSKTLEVDSSGRYCMEACEESLTALGVPCIDLLYIHSVNTNTPIEETMRALKELQDQGKIKHIGLSNVSSRTLIRASKIAHVAANQSDYSLFALDIEGAQGGDLLKVCRELGTAFVAAMPLNRGVLTSTYADGKEVGDEKDIRGLMLPRFMKENKEKNEALVSQFQSLAQSKNCTVSQLSLAWLLKQGDDIIPIPGTKRIKYLEENWVSQDVELSDADEKEVRAWAESVRSDIAGGCLPKKFEDHLYRDTVEEK